MKTISLLSPAKLNLFLKVVNKRPDQYHNLVTLFEKINLFDKLSLTLNKRGDIRIFCDNPSVPKGTKNLAYQAARLLKEEVAFQNGVDIKIIKRIPVAAGLAGGSSNAAITLVGLNKLWKLGLTKKDLIGYAKKLGSDVPLFIHDCSWALGTQRGDEVKKLPFPTKLWHILIVPGIKVYSREVFTRLKLQLTKKDADVNMLTRALKKRDLSTAGGLLFNDLESMVVQLHPKLLILKERLNRFKVRGVCLSGSGPSIFGLTDSPNQAYAIKSHLEKIYKNIFVVRTL